MEEELGLEFQVERLDHASWKLSSGCVRLEVHCRCILLFLFITRPSSGWNAFVILDDIERILALVAMPVVAVCKATFRMVSLMFSRVPLCEAFILLLDAHPAGYLEEEQETGQTDLVERVASVNTEVHLAQPA